MGRSSSNQRIDLEVLRQPGSVLGDAGPTGSPDSATQERLDVVETIHRLIDTLTDWSEPHPAAQPPYPSQDLPLLLDAVEAAKLLSLSRAKVSALARNGQIPSVRVGRLVRIPRDPLFAWIEANTNTGQYPPPPRLPEWAHVDRSAEL